MEKCPPPTGLEKLRARAGRLGDASKNPKPGDPQCLPWPAMAPPDTGRRGLCEESGQRSQASGGTLPKGNLLFCLFPTLEKGHALQKDGAPGLRKGRQGVREAGGKCDLVSAPTSWVGSWPHHPQMGAISGSSPPPLPWVRWAAQPWEKGREGDVFAAGLMHADLPVFSLLILPATSGASYDPCPFISLIGSSEETGHPRVRAGFQTHGHLPSCKASEVSAAPGSQGRSLRLGLWGGCEMELPSPGRAHIHQAGDPSVPALCGV